MVEKYILLQKQILTISYSKQSFEQEMSLSMFDDKNFELKTYWKPPHGLQALFNILEDHTLDLETKLTLFDQNRI